jgi:type VI secretion system protein VasD
MIQRLNLTKKLLSRGIISLTFAFALLAGCGTLPEPTSVFVEGSIKASNVLNPDIKGGYRPVNIKIFYLKSAEGFSDASFTDLFKYPDKALGGNILDLRTQQVLPGQKIEISEELPLGLRYIGVLAAYRNLDEATWKDIKPVPEKCFSCIGAGLWDPILIKLDRLKVSIDTGTETAKPQTNN